MSTKPVRKRSADSRAEIIRKLSQTLDAKRFKHSLRVEAIALALGKRWKVDSEKLSQAALLHDCGRRFDRQELLREAKRIGLKIDPIRKTEPKLFHAEISAHLAKSEFGVRSAGVLRAICRHTIGAPAMSRLEKIIFLADHIEEGRIFSGVKKMRKLAFADLDRAILESTDRMLGFLIKSKLPIFPGTVITRNAFLDKRR